MRTACEQARAGLNPVYRTQLPTIWLMLTIVGVEAAQEMVGETVDALRGAEEFGDTYGVIAARFIHGSVLLRCSESAHGEGIDLLERARADITKHQMLNEALSAIQVELARVGAHSGPSGRRREAGIDPVRAVSQSYVDGGVIGAVDSPAEVLVELLLERGSADDLVEARAVVADLEARQLPSPIPGLDLFRLKCRALVTKAEGDAVGYAAAAEEYLELTEQLDARGRLEEARRMVAEIT